MTGSQIIQVEQEIPELEPIKSLSKTESQVEQEIPVEETELESMKSLSKFETNTVKSEIIKGIAFEEPVDVDIENPNGKQFNFDFIKVEDSQVLLTESNYIKV